MQPQLAQAAVDTESLIKKVTADQLAADEQQAIVEKDVEEANKVAANVQVIKDDCQKVCTWITSCTTNAAAHGERSSDIYTPRQHLAPYLLSYSWSS